MIYLDNAATTWPKPPCVTEAVVSALKKYGANPGRGGHTMSMAASREVFLCRETAARMFNLEDPSGVVFVLNCTMALNIALKGILAGGGRVTVSDLEHNTVMRPLYALSPGKPIYDVAHVVAGNDNATVENFRRTLSSDTKAIVCTHASNVFGIRLPIRRLGALAREKGLLFVVDGAQTAGVLPIDMQEDNIDFLCLAGHKGLYGPMGTGMLLCSGRFSLPLYRGGNRQPVSSVGTAGGSAQPAGKRHPQHAGYLWAAGRNGMGFRPHGIDNICRKETQQMALAYDLLSTVPGIRLYTARPQIGQCAPVLSLNLKGHCSEELAVELNRYGVAVRAGLRCAPVPTGHMARPRRARRVWLLPSIPPVRRSNRPAG